MTALNKLSIPQLIARLNSLGVEWVGSTTRKAPLIETINRFAYNADYLHNDKEAEITAKGLLKGQDYPVCNLVGLLRYWRQTVTSDEVADPHTLQQRVLEIARQKYPTAEPLPSLDKVLSYSWEDLKCLPIESLRIVAQRTGLPLYLQCYDLDQEKRNMIHDLKPTLAGMRRRPDRDLVFDPAGCQYVYESKTGFQHKIAEDMWENPTKPLYHALVLQDFKQRGFYEPDCVTDTLHGLYLVCDLADAPFLKMGEKVKLRDGATPVRLSPGVWFNHGESGKIVAKQGLETCRVHMTKWGEHFYFTVPLAALVKDSEPEQIYLKPGDRVTLKPETKSLTSFTRDYDWFSPGDVGTIEAALPDECIIQAIRGGTIQKFRANPKDLRISTLD